MLWGHKMKRFFGGIIKYYNAHIWCQFISLYIVAVIGIASIFQLFLKTSYYNILLSSQTSMESSVLNSAQSNINTQLEDYINVGAMMATSDDICLAIEGYEKESNSKNKKLVQTLFNSAARNSGKLVSMAVINDAGLLYQCNTYKTGTRKMWEPADTKYLKNAYSEVSEAVASGKLPRCVIKTNGVEQISNNDLAVFHIFMPLLGSTYKLDSYDKVLCLTFSSDVFTDYLNYIESSDIDYLFGYITDANGKIICHSDSTYLWTSDEEYIKSNDIIKQSAAVSIAQWNLNVAYNEAALWKYIDGIFNKAMPIYAVMLLVLCLVIYLVINRILKPVRKIKKAITHITQEEKRHVMTISGTNEIWQLAMTYNDMLGDLEEKEKEVEVNHEKAMLYLSRQHEAERESLETQINSHFICNTLNTINYEAIENGNYSVSILIKKLSNILRYSFTQKSQNVFFFQEFSWIEQYLYLMKARLEDVFSYEIYLDDEMGNYPCCKLMLQPFVENAILHGFEGIEEGGILKINGVENGDRLEVTIADNGHGMSEHTASLIKDIFEGKEIDSSQLGIGIENVYARIKLYYGDEAKLSIRTKLEEGTEFKFSFPKKKLA